MAATG